MIFGLAVAFAVVLALVLHSALVRPVLFLRAVVLEPLAGEPELDPGTLALVRAFEALGLTRAGGWRCEVRGHGDTGVSLLALVLHDARRETEVEIGVTVARERGRATGGLRFVELASEGTDGRRASTMNVETDPEHRLRAVAWRFLPGEEDAARLLAAHEEHVAALGLARVPHDPATFGARVARDHAAIVEGGLAHGAFEVRGEDVVASRAHQLGRALRGLGIAAGPGARVERLRLFGLAALGALLAFSVARPGLEPWVHMGLACVLMGALSGAAAALARSTGALSWPVVLAPAVLLLDASGVSSAWPWLAAALAAVSVGVQQARRDRSKLAPLARSVDGPAAGPGVYKPALPPVEAALAVGLAWAAGAFADGLVFERLVEGSFASLEHLLREVLADALRDGALVGIAYGVLAASGAKRGRLPGLVAILLASAAVAAIREVARAVPQPWDPAQGSADLESLVLTALVAACVPALLGAWGLRGAFRFEGRLGHGIMLAGPPGLGLMVTIAASSGHVTLGASQPLFPAAFFQAHETPVLTLGVALAMPVASRLVPRLARILGVHTRAATEVTT